MPLSPGDKFGPYEIVSPVGAGGMGEVYRARDSKLHRDVAIKVLPAALANDADYLGRFQREAQALAALHHPHIATIFGLEQNAIVMELVEGKPPQGPLSLGEALPIARQIAEALEAAHEKGIIHRDLKPGNILVTAEGVVKVLDFGLAKAVERSVGGNTADSPTLTMRATEAGLILGTAGYMSPEQAAGRPVDRRADIWSFGVVLHELLTGKRLFDGETVSHTLAEVLKTEIDFTQIQRGPIRELVKRCLDRNLKTRLQHIGEARIAIERFLANPKAEEPARTKGSRLPWVIAAVCGGVAAVAIIALRPVPSVPPEPVMFTVGAPADTTLFYALPVLTPDGRNLIFRARSNKEGKYLLYVRSLDSLETRSLPGTENPVTASSSANSRSVCFFADGSLKRADLAGGRPQIVVLGTAADAGARGCAWNVDGVIVFGPSAGKGLFRVSASGGVPVEFTALDASRKETTHAWPSFLPDQRHVLYFASSTQPENEGVYVKALDGGAAKLILRGVSAAKFASGGAGGPGQLLFVRDGVLMAQPFDLRALTLTGEPVPVAQDVFTVGGLAYFTVSPTGVLAFWSENPRTDRTLTWTDRSGNAVGVDVVASTSSLELSSDARKVLTVATASKNPDIWLHDLDRGAATRLTSHPKSDVSPVWSADARFVYFASNRDGNFNLYRKEAGGAGPDELLFKHEGSAFPTNASSDGRYLLFRTFSSKSSNDLWVLPLQGEDKPFPLLQTEFGEARGQFSPDGRWIAYASNESGTPAVYVQPFLPDGDSRPRGKWRVSPKGGSMPRWRKDGKELFYIGLDGKFTAVPIRSTATAFEPGVPVPLFDSGVRPTRAESDGISYGVTADGQRLLISVPRQAAEPEITVMLNWQAVLSRGETVK